MLLSLIIVSVIPGVLWLTYFYRKDRFEPEPKKLVAKVFIGGMLMVVPAGALELVGKEGLMVARTSGNVLLIFIYSFFFIGVIEEGLKFLLLALTVYPRKEMNEPVDGIVYGITVGLGFAVIENLFYTEALGFQVGLWRAVIACLAHAAFSGWGGYFLTAGLRRLSIFYRFLIAYGVATFWHGLYDFLLFLNNPIFSLGSFVLTGLLVYMLLKKMRELEAYSPFRS
ncbi:MAG TPA: PrsW family intramembrane metalloprotease [Firmicutes bacterium]|nr:PrsW family intramembrane metalloprotease [Bacillota bacterium]HBT16052.1 PrsW family intramembrane metalloprotease [Bacillota bacterium]